MKKLALLILCLLLPVTAHAFPDNAVLDPFTGAGPTTPPSANWTNGWTASATGLQLLDNGATTTTLNVGGSAYWNAATFGPNCEAYVTMSALAGTTQGGAIGCRLVDVGVGTTEGYFVNVNKTQSKIEIYKVVNGVGTKLGTTNTKTIAVGDSFGIRIVGDRICGWYKVGAGAWSEVICRTDSTYAAAGKLGLNINGSNAIAQFDNFGGGTITPLCSGASPTWVPSSVDQLAINDCIALSTTGDTINIPVGTTTILTTELQTVSQGAASIVIDKGITLHGETVCSGVPTTCVDGTIFLDGTSLVVGSTPITMTGTNARITGITYQDPRVLSAGSFDSGSAISIACSNCRFDHNSMIDTVATGAGYKSHGILVISIIDATQLIDHNYFKDLNGAVDPHGTSLSNPVEGGASLAPNWSGSLSWRSPLTLGDANAVYIEDNNFDYTAGVVADGAYDAYNGARLVFRFNTVKSTNMGGHGLDSSFRSTLRQEIYRNNISNAGAAVYTPIQTRGGVHMVWQNVVPSTGGSYNSFMWITNYRSDGTGCSVCGVTEASSAMWPCDGTNKRDQNTTSYEGWLCRDQVGTGPGTAAAAQTDWPIDTVNHIFSEVALPAYSWGNVYKDATPTLPGSFIGDYTLRSGASGGDWTRVQTLHLLNNRDFYIEAASFDGSSGTGQGTLAARPATCTTGVAYFATDQGSWNTSTTDGTYNPSTVAGEDGLLYKCTATNTWTLYYTPYTHPHPLQAVALTAPTGLRVITQASGNSACLVWGVSDIVNLAGYRIYHGLSSSAYTLAADIPINSVNTRHMPDTQYCYASPVGGTHYFNMTAYNSDTVESALATEVSATFTALSRTTASARGGSSTRDPLQ